MGHCLGLDHDDTIVPSPVMASLLSPGEFYRELTEDDLAGHNAIYGDPKVKQDLAVYHAATGEWHIHFSGDGQKTKVWGWSQATAAPGDYDGDGVTDLAVYHAATGSWYINYSGGGSTTASWGWAAAVPAPGDYDGDGVTDLAVYDAATGNWHISFSSGRATVETWGGPSVAPATVPAAGNYDGS